MTAAVSDAFVFFGATGDLAYKQTFPALQTLVRDAHLDMPIICVAKSDWTINQLKERAKDSIDKHGGIDKAAFEKLCSLFKYVAGDYKDANTYNKLKEALAGAKHPLYYLAIPPVLFGTVAEGLNKAGCVEGARLVVEKPFGHDLESAKDLNSILHKFFPEENIFRIDHFLGKESVENLTYFRFANPTVHASWNNTLIHSVQITMAESFDIKGRGKFYDAEGAIRDVVQNHILQIIANLAMESPSEHSGEAWRNQRGRLLQDLRTVDPSDVVRGQFKGYHDEPGVAPDSKVETFVALRFYIDNERWRGVPFFVRTGKCLPVTATEVIVRFRQNTHSVLDETVPHEDCYYRFRVGAKELIALGVKIKTPGRSMVGESTELVLNPLQDSEKEMPPYERLLGDATKGDNTLFVREDCIEASWRALSPILDNATPIYEYEPNTWGPAEVNSRVEPDGGWSDPQPEPPK